MRGLLPRVTRPLSACHARSDAQRWSAQAAALAGGGLAVRGDLLRELLASSGAFGMLLGGGGPGGEAGAPLR
jgi:hypothetical protein